ncbi:MAG: ABC transporter permease [Verrucomicrobia bacterium]|nr:ABC transporter permease [Verrucomicrobiota bacterium]
MKPALLIGHNDLRLFLRNRSSFIWLFVLPLAMMYFMGFAVRGPGDPSNPRPSVLVENLDTNFLGRVFLSELGAQGLKLVAPTNRAEAQRGLRLPADFTQRVLSGQQSKVEFFTVPGSGDEAAAMIELRLVRALVAVNSHLVEHVLRHGTNAPLTEDALSLLQKREDLVKLDATFAGHKPRPVGFKFSLPGNMVMYLLMNLLIFGGATIAWERRGGQLRRVAVHPVSRGALVLGKLYGLMLLAAVQVAFYLLAGQFLFGVDLGEHLGALLFTLLIYAWVAAALGVLIGSVVRAEDKVVGLCVLASLVMAAVGGCWWPIELMSGPLKIAAHCVPTGWAMDALHQLITFGGGLAAVGKPIGVLALFGAGATVAAAKFFRV